LTQGGSDQDGMKQRDKPDTQHITNFEKSEKTDQVIEYKLRRGYQSDESSQIFTSLLCFGIDY